MPDSNKNDVLKHYGILGQKWGVRRYQNKDGTLTAAGKKRADKLRDEYTQLTGKKLIRKPTPKSSDSNSESTSTSNNTTNAKKKIKDMSDSEIRDTINRYESEKRLRALQSERASSGEKFVRSIKNNVVVPAAIEAGKSLARDLLLKIGKEKLGLNNNAGDAAEDVYKELRKEVDGLKLKRNKYQYQKEIEKFEEEQRKNRTQLSGK